MSSARNCRETRLQLLLDQYADSKRHRQAMIREAEENPGGCGFRTSKQELEASILHDDLFLQDLLEDAKIIDSLGPPRDNGRPSFLSAKFLGRLLSEGVQYVHVTNYRSWGEILDLDSLAGIDLESWDIMKEADSELAADDALVNVEVLKEELWPTDDSLETESKGGPTALIQLRTALGSSVKCLDQHGKEIPAVGKSSSVLAIESVPAIVDDTMPRSSEVKDFRNAKKRDD